MMNYLAALLGGYLLGCSNMAFYLSRLKQVDLCKKGTGNLGASNAALLLGWKAGLLVALHDIGKAALAVYLAQLIFPDARYIGAVAGVGSVLGHIFPFYHKFRGGKGLASFLGMTLMLNWKLTLFMLLLVLVITLLTDYIVAGTMSAVAAVPMLLGVADKSLIPVLIIGTASLVMLWKHRENFVRMSQGTEIRLGDTIKDKLHLK